MRRHYKPPFRKYKRKKKKVEDDSPSTLLCMALTLLFAILFGLVEFCALQLFFIYNDAAMTGASAIHEYPRFIPFCIAAGILGIAAIVAVVVFCIRKKEKFKLPIWVLILQMAAGFCASLPMFGLWGVLFHTLQELF